MYCNISLKKSFLLYKIWANITRLASKNLIKVTLNKTDYLEKMENLLNEVHKYTNLKKKLKNDVHFSFAVNQEKRIDNIFKKFICV